MPEKTEPDETLIISSGHTAELEEHKDSSLDADGPTDLRAREVSVNIATAIVRATGDALDDAGEDGLREEDEIALVADLLYSDVIRDHYDEIERYKRAVERFSREATVFGVTAAIEADEKARTKKLEDVVMRLGFEVHRLQKELLKK